MIDPNLKVSLMGGQGVGKSTFLKNEEDYYKDSDSLTIHQQILQIDTENGTEDWNLLVWSHPSNPDYLPLNCDILILLFNLDQIESFKKAQELKKAAIPILPRNSVVVIIGNIRDNKQREVDQKIPKDYCKKNKILYYEMSIQKDKSKIYQIFNDIAKKLKASGPMFSSYKEIEQVDYSGQNCAKCKIF